MRSNLFKKIALASIFSVLVLPGMIFAQTGNTTTNTTTTVPPRAIIVNENSQAYGSLYGVQSGNGGSGNVATGLASCLAAGGLANFVKNEISNFAGSITGTRVPTSNPVQEGKDTGIFGVISWDQMGYCAVNEIIAEISRATVNWINSGFKGNPTFVDDPEQFFADIADIHAGQFLNELSSGFLCAPIKDIVRVNLASNYNSRNSLYRQKAQCSFTSISGNLEQFMSGQSFGWDDWISYTQNPYNNPVGATLGGSIELNRRIAQSLGTQSKLLDWSKGFLSFKDPSTGKISSPGTVIEGQINQRLFNGENRISMADEFDEIVTALVNQIVKIAINEITTSN